MILALLRLVWDLATAAAGFYAVYVILFKVPRLERDLKAARAAILGYVTARAEPTSKVRR